MGKGEGQQFRVIVGLAEEPSEILARTVGEWYEKNYREGLKGESSIMSMKGEIRFTVFVCLNFKKVHVSCYLPLSLPNKVDFGSYQRYLFTLLVCLWFILSNKEEGSHILK